MEVRIRLVVDMFKIGVDDRVEDRNRKKGSVLNNTVLMLAKACPIIVDQEHDIRMAGRGRRQ